MGLKQLEECSGMLSVYCVCHCLSLAFGLTGDDLKLISDFETTMIQLWTFSKTSQNVYKISNKVKRIWISPLGTTEISCAEGKKADKTRWLSLDVGVKVVYKEYTYSLHALRLMKDEEDASTGATIAGVLKKVDDMKFELQIKTYVGIFINIE